MRAFSGRVASFVDMNCTPMDPRCSLLSLFIHDEIQGPELVASSVPRTSTCVNCLNYWKGKCCVSGPAFGLFLVASEAVLDAGDLLCEMRVRCRDSGRLV